MTANLCSAGENLTRALSPVLVLVICFPIVGCQATKRDREDSLFQKRLACATAFKDVQQSGERPNPATGLYTPTTVLYSPKLDTCVGIFYYTVTITPSFVGGVWVDDLLTGQNLEHKHVDCRDPAQCSDLAAYYEEVIKRYGGRVP